MSMGYTTIPQEIIDCIAHDREPRVRDLKKVADHIRADIRGNRAGDQGSRDDRLERMMSLRAAVAAMAGCG